MPFSEPLATLGMEAEPLSVLLVDDEILLRSMIADYLRLKGFKIVEAGNVSEAKRALSIAHDIRFIITDIHMPGDEDGLHLVEYPNLRHPTIPALVMSGTIGGANGWPFLRKPFRLDDLLSVIQALLTKSPEGDLLSQSRSTPAG